MQKKLEGGSFKFVTPGNRQACCFGHVGS